MGKKVDAKAKKKDKAGKSRKKLKGAKAVELGKAKKSRHLDKGKPETNSCAKAGRREPMAAAYDPYSCDLLANLRVDPATVDIDSLDPSATPGYPLDEGKDCQDEVMSALAEPLSDLQECLWANGKEYPGDAKSVLLVLQGLDTSGKGGVIRHAVGLVDPQGVALHAFKRPTEEELSHNFLWRIRRELPAPGMIGVFDRSHYEDVLAVRVEKLVQRRTWQNRFRIINEFEQELVESGTTVIKCFLNVSKDEQKRRLLARLDDPQKYWKYEPGDLDTRQRWDDYMDAYQDVLEKCSTPWAPWYVIPADRKWYRNWAVAQILFETLAGLGLSWPEAKFDPQEQKRLLQGL